MRAVARADRTDPRLALGTPARPVLLVTLGVPFEPRAASLAVDASVEAGAPLVVANVVELAPLGMCVNTRRERLEDPPQLAASLRAPAQLAHALGVDVERLRVSSPRPVQAVLELAAERVAGLLVFGPDRAMLRRRRYDRAVRAIRARSACLVWAED